LAALVSFFHGDVSQCVASTVDSKRWVCNVCYVW